MRGLFETHPSIVDAETRRQSRLLAVCIAVLTPLFVCVDTTLVMTTPGYKPPWVGYLFLIGTFALNRSGRYRMAASISMAMFPIVAFGQLYIGTVQRPILPLGYVALGPMLGAIFLPFWGVAALTILNLVGIGITALLLPEVAALGPLLAGPLSINAMVGVLASFYMLHRNAVEADRRRELLAEIAEREQLEDRLRQAQKMEALGQFAGGIAHDFNNVLMVILGNVTVLSRRVLPISTEVSSEVTSALTAIENAVSSAASLTRQLLAFGRRAVIEPTVLDVGQVVHETVTMMRRIIGETIVIHDDVPNLPLLAKLDRAQLEQVLLNLATNARDAMPSGGTLRITASARHLTRGQGELPPDNAEGTYVCLSVTDDGMGMDEDTRERVFEPFFTTKPRGRGTGLGLATVFGIVTQSAGFVRVVSQPGRGTTFDLFFPRSTQPIDSIAEPVSAAPARGVERILVVEDDDGVRAVVSMILAEAGYDIVQARSLRQARAQLDELGRTIALVITDLVLSDGHGLDLALEVRKRHPCLPVLCMSGYAEREGRDGGMQGGMQGLAHLQKPFSFDELLSKVRGLLDAAHAEQKRPMVTA